MVFQDAKIKDNTITLTKEELIEARDHYCKVAEKFKPKPKRDKIDVRDFRYGFYLGKVEVLNDMLKMFEPIDYV